MNKAYLTYCSAITPLGNDVQTIFNKVKNRETGIQLVDNAGFQGESLPLGKIDTLPSENRFTALFETICKSTADQLTEAFKAKNPQVIISSTKAEIDALPGDAFEIVRTIARQYFPFCEKPMIISNACISGVLAVNTAADLIRIKEIEAAIVIGVDAVSEFITFGFQSLYAISDTFCKPYDKERKGINLGECGASVLLENEPFKNQFYVEHLGGSSSNDANHISGPSRTGEGLVRSIQKSMKQGNVSGEQLDFISAHGTATLYNDEMESIAFGRLNINAVPMNSMKGYFGHTLGAAGVIETIVSLKMMETNTLIPNLGYQEQGTSVELNVIQETQEQSINTVLKTSSGFGGGNATLILQKR